jgi:uncharacterized membrane protein (DUF106 family)
MRGKKKEREREREKKKRERERERERKKKRERERERLAQTQTVLLKSSTLLLFATLLVPNIMFVHFLLSLSTHSFVLFFHPQLVFSCKYTTELLTLAPTVVYSTSREKDTHTFF